MKFPCAVKPFLRHVQSLATNYTSKDLVQVCVATVWDVAKTNASRAAQKQYSMLNAQGVGRLMGFTRIMCHLNILQKVDKPRRYNAQVVQLGIRGFFRVVAKTAGIRLLLAHCREHAPNTSLMEPPVPGGQTQRMVDDYVEEYQNMLSKFPLSWCMHPHTHEDKPDKKRYVSGFVLRKHLWWKFASVGWPSGQGWDMRWLLKVCPDSKRYCEVIPEDTPVDVVERLVGRPYRELSMWLCLFGPVLKFLKKQGQGIETYMPALHGARGKDIISQFKNEYGIPPTPAALFAQIAADTPKQKVDLSGIQARRVRRRIRMKTTIRGAKPRSAGLGGRAPDTTAPETRSASLRGRKPQDDSSRDSTPEIVRPQTNGELVPSDSKQSKGTAAAAKRRAPSLEEEVQKLGAKHPKVASQEQVCKLHVSQSRASMDGASPSTVSQGGACKGDAAMDESKGGASVIQHWRVDASKHRWVKSDETAAELGMAACQCSGNCNLGCPAKHQRQDGCPNPPVPATDPPRCRACSCLLCHHPARVPHGPIKKYAFLGRCKEHWCTRL